MDYSDATVTGNDSHVVENVNEFFVGISDSVTLAHKCLQGHSHCFLIILIIAIDNNN